MKNLNTSVPYAIVTLKKINVILFRIIFYSNTYEAYIGVVSYISHNTFNINYKGNLHTPLPMHQVVEVKVVGSTVTTRHSQIVQ